MVISGESAGSKPKWAEPLRAVGWVVGGFLVIVGLSGIIMELPDASRAYSATMGVTLLLLGLTIIPSSFAVVGNRVPLLSPWYARVLLIFAVAVLGTSVARQMPGAPRPKVAGQPPVPPESPAYSAETSSSGAAAPEPAPKAAPDERWSDAAFVKDYVGKRLKDPDSAKFQDVWAFRSGEKLTYCGQVNSKNGFGGYTGFEPFVISDAGFTIGDKAILVALQLCEGGVRTAVPLD